MGFLNGKRALITGVASTRSIAWGIAKAMHREGAQVAFFFQGERFASRMTKLAAELDSKLTFPCDVADDEQIERAFSDLSEAWDSLDIIVHSIAYAPREALVGNFVDNTDRESFRIAHEVSSYSLIALARAGRSMMAGRNGAILTMSYLGADRAIPHYNVMGPAKASLEANVRYLAHALGPEGTRINALSAGPIKTLAAAGIGDFRKLLDYAENASPMKRNVNIDEVGNAAAFMCSDLASGITGEVMFVDAGFSFSFGVEA